MYRRKENYSKIGEITEEEGKRRAWMKMIRRRNETCMRKE
jgi:hypothetical protein